MGDGAAVSGSPSTVRTIRTEKFHDPGSSDGKVCWFDIPVDQPGLGGRLESKARCRPHRPPSRREAPRATAAGASAVNVFHD